MTQSETMAGKRRAERVPSKARGSIRFGVQLELIDVTDLGVRAKAPFDVPAGTIVALGFGGTTRHAKVIWSGGGEIGCEFVKRLAEHEFMRVVEPASIPAFG